MTGKIEPLFQDAAPQSPLSEIFKTRRAPIHDRPADDWYCDPVWCTELLLENEIFAGGQIWDPCAGGGNVISACQKAGLWALGTDLAPKAPHIIELDFMSDHRHSAANIAFNPPYKHAEAFIRRALDLATHKVAALVQQQFPFSQGRHKLFTETPIARLYYLSTRPSMPPGRLLQAGEIEARGGKTNYLWMVWDKGWKGAPQAFWLKRGKQ